MLTARVEAITPEKAEEYLEMNTRNYRNMNQDTVNKYALDMRSGRWEENGAPISFYENGVLFDGQHRLKAIAKSGTTVKMLVVHGIPNDTTIADWGQKRTISQWGKANELDVTTTMGGVARMILKCASAKAVPMGAVTQYIEEHYSGIKESERLAKTGKKNPIGCRAPMVTAIYVVRRLGLVSDVIIEQFFRVFNTGTVSGNEMRDPSAPLTASRQIITKYKSGQGNDAQRDQYEIVMQALLDYKKNVNRRREYRHKPEMFNFIEKLRMEDGI